MFQGCVGAALLVVALTGCANAQELEYVGSYTWKEPAESFGGLSGLEVDSTGERFFAVSDSSILYAGRFQRDAEGRISGVDLDRTEKLISQSGNYINDVNGQTEGLALGDDGRLWVSTEGYHTVNFIEPDDHIVMWIDGHPGF